jgi:hypothetical protein
MNESTAQPAQESGWISTPTSERILTALSYAHQAHDISVVYGGAGLGKTTAARHYMEAFERVWMATMSPDVCRAAGALEEVCGAVGVMGAIAAARSRRAIMNKLEDRPGLLIIDEAQALSVEALESIRSIYDASNIGLALLGNTQVYSRLGGGRRDAVFAQLYSRIGCRVPLFRATKADVECIAAAYGVEGKAELQFLQRIAAAHGALRVLSKVVADARRASDGAPLTLEQLQAAWARLGGDA